MVRYRDLFVVREFRYLYVGLIVSYVGDQLAAVAVAVLVFNRTNSGLLTGLAYASAFLPALAGPVLGAYADRLPRRALMVCCDLMRALVVAALVIPGMLIWLMIVLLFAGHTFTPLFVAARSAILPEVLDGERYVAGNGLRTITVQLCQVVGAAGGGVVVVARRTRLRAGDQRRLLRRVGRHHRLRRALPPRRRTSRRGEDGRGRLA